MINLINKAKNLGWDLEVKETLNKYLQLRTLNDEVKQFESSDINYYNVKAFILNKWVSLSCEDISDQDEIISELEKNALILDNEDKDFLATNKLVSDAEMRTGLDIDAIRNDLLKLNN